MRQQHLEILAVFFGDGTAVNKRFNKASNKFVGTDSGLTIEGYLRDGEVPTFFVTW